MNEKKNAKIKICFPKDREVLWDMSLPRNIPKKKKITKSYFFQTFFNFLFVIYMYNFLKVTSAVKFIICYY